MAHCLVTGGAGFIGSHLVEALVARGDEVRVVDNLSSGTRENLAAVAGKIDLVEADLRDPETARKCARGVEVIFHQAALVSVPRSLEEPLACHASGAGATLHVLEAARRAGVRRVVLASSSSVYGNTGAEVNDESMPCSPVSPYGATKAAAEVLAQAWRRSFGLETVSLRYFNVFGPRQSDRTAYAAVVPKFIRAALAGKPLPIYGDGKQSRDFTGVADVVRANLLAAAAPADRVAGEVFNVAAGSRRTVSELAAALGELLGRRLEVEHLPPRAGEILHSGADISRARAAFGFAPEVSLADGLALAVGFFRGGA